MNDLLDLDDVLDSRTAANDPSATVHPSLDLLVLTDDVNTPERPSVSELVQQNVLEEDFGDFQDPGTTRDAEATVRGASTQGVNAVEKPIGDSLEPQDQDEFGDFVESPRIISNSFQSSSKDDWTQVEIPQPAVLLNILRQAVLVIPKEFLDRLALLPHSQRQAVLQHEKTNRWIRGVVEGFQIAQRIIHGRQRRDLSKSELEAAHLASMRTAETSTTLMPRLSSLSQGRMKFKAVDNVALGLPIPGSLLCGLCFTYIEDHGHTVSVRIDTMHRSCGSFLEHHFIA